MARSSLWCLAALFLALLFVTANGLRGPASQVEGRESRTTPKSRGGSRFNLKANEDLASSTTPFSSTVSGPSRTRNGRRGGSRTVETSRSEVTTLRSRGDHSRDIKLSTGNAQKSNVSPPVSSKFERRRPSSPSATRKTSTEISPREKIADTPTTEVYKIIKNERQSIAIDSESQRAKEPQEPRRIGLFRARNGVAARRGSTTTTTTEKVIQEEDSGVSREFDTTGPSVFSGTTEIPRSRTGRKIQKTLSSGDLKSGLPTSGRFTSTRQNAQRRNGQEDEISPNFAASSRSQRRSDDFSAKRRHDIVSSGSESVSFDIPLISEAKARSRVYNSLSPPSAEDGTSSSSRHGSSAGNGRGRGRGRSTEDKNTETTTASRSASRRGSSRFAETAPLNDNSLEKTRSRSETTHSRNTEKRDERSRSRGRSQETTTIKSSARSEHSNRNSEAKRNSGRRNRTVETNSTDPNLKSVDSEARSRSRTKSRAAVTSLVPLTTTVLPEETTITIATAESITTPTQVTFASTTTTTPSTTTVQQQTEPTAEARISRNRGRPSTTPSTSKKVPKEDFFNHGLGFRGRKIVTEAPREFANNQNPSKNDSARRGNPGWTLKRRPGYRPEDIETTTARSSATTENGAATISNEIPTGNDNSESTTASLAEKPTKARGSKRPSETVNDADNNDRGGKSFKKTTPGVVNKVNKDIDEGDNYPPEFKARLAQLKNGVQQATAKPSLGELSEKYTTRHTRSTSATSESKAPGDDRETEIPISTLVSIISDSTTPFSGPFVTDTPGTTLIEPVKQCFYCCCLIVSRIYAEC